MSVSAEHLRRIAALNLSPEAMKEVLAVMADVADDGAAKRMRAERNRRYYEKAVLKRLNSASESVLNSSENVLETSENPPPLRGRGLNPGLGLLESKKEDKSSLRSDSSIGQNGCRIDLPAVAKPKPKRDASEADAVVDGFLEGWSRLASQCGIAGYRAITDSRRAKIIARARDLTTALDFPDPAAGFADLMARIRGSPFLLGQTGDRRWRIDLDWVLTESNFLKIMEGKYAASQKPISQFGGNFGRA